MASTGLRTSKPWSSIARAQPRDSKVQNRALDERQLHWGIALPAWSCRAPTFSGVDDALLPL